MELENVENYGDLVEFFNERGFKNYNEEFKEFDVCKLYKIRLEEVDNFPESVAALKKYISKLKNIGKNVTYYLIYTPDFNKFCFMRQVGDPFKFVYDKERIQNLPTETRLSLLNKLKGLKYKDDIFNETLENLFDVKEIVKKFFEKYKNIIKILSNGITIENTDSELYAQILMERIIFLYFLQTKGVFSSKYLSENFESLKSYKNKNYYNDFLRPLFFEMLNNENRDKNAEQVINGINFGKVPYLNGGLFREKDFEKGATNIEIKNEVWNDIFGLLNNYEWVVEEQKGDSTVLTPAILGHIYEKSVIAATQKETGSYYTPEEITNYISMNTIYPYITDRINEKFGTKYRYIYNELLNKKDHSGREIEMISFLYFDVLKKLKILDNACGSGAFLIAALYVLIPIYRTCINILAENDKENFKKELEEISNMKTLEYYIKRTIITNNLYGVDIQEGAVEICKLRLWLSMVSDVDKDNIEPLPNIDYNIMCGNSLIGFVKAPDDEQFNLFECEKIKMEQRTLTEPKEYQMRMNIPTVKNIMNTKGILVNEYKKTRNSKQAEELKKNIENINNKFRPILNDKLLREFKDKKIEIEKGELDGLNPFHWGFEFYEVFDLEKPKEERGFDIIIGNPPYINIRGLTKHYNKSKDIFNLLYKSASGLYDILVVFVERSINLLKKSGNFCYILSNKFTVADYGKYIRKIILENTSLYLLSDVSTISVFRDVGCYPIIMAFSKTVPTTENRIRIEKIRDIKELGRNFQLVKQKDFLQERNNLFVFGEAGTGDIINTIVQDSKLLKDLGVLHSGTTGFEYQNWGKLIRGELSKQSTKHCKFIITGNIERYNINEKKRVRYQGKSLQKPVLIFDKRITEGKWQLFSSEKIVIRGMAKKLTAALDNIGYALGVSVYAITDLSVSPEIILCIINSKLIDFYYKEKFISKHLAGGYIGYNKGQLEQIPIKLPQNQQPFITLCNYMLFLNKTEQRIKSEKEMIEFIDKQIIDSLVYEIYFAGELKTNLVELVSPYLTNISVLSSDSEKLNTIKKVYNNLIQDEKILNLIKEIRGHKWVKIIEKS